jgi:hypothetical protein
LDLDLSVTKEERDLLLAVARILRAKVRGEKDNERRPHDLWSLDMALKAADPDGEGE